MPRTRNDPSAGQGALQKRRGAPPGNRNAAKDGDPGFTITVYVTMDQHKAIRALLEQRNGRKPTLNECKAEAKRLCKQALEQLISGKGGG